MLNYNKVEMRYEPYPLAILRPALAPDTYDELVTNFPDTSLFGTLNKFPYKLSLSEKFAPENYARFLRENKPWNRFHSWVKSDDFIRSTIDFLNANHVELPVEDAFEGGSARLKRIGRALAKGNLPSPAPRLRSRFEFSVLKADGGLVEPHTDAAKKIITLVVSMIKDGEWDPAFGGGLDMNRATDNRYAFNWKNRLVPWDKIEIVETIPFVPNQCILFVKTFNSLHSVRRMNQTGSNALRKTVTIVIERED
jgi:hypothetical protein